MSTPMRYLAGVAAAAVATAGLAVVGLSPAQGAEAGDEATLSWAFSTYMQAGQFPNQSVSDGATEDDGVVTFGDGSVVHSGSGITDLAYHGTVTFARTGAYSVTFTDPEVSVDADGAGTITADVAYSAPGSSGDAGVHTLTTFDATSASRWTSTSLSATPKWDDAVPADTYGTGKPVDGQSWDSDFVLALPSSIRAFFYASGQDSASDAKKAPAAFTATMAAPQVGSTATSSTHAGGVTWEVTGSGFREATLPGDAGVYVGVAPAGGLPDVSSTAGMSAFAAVAWLSSSPGASAPLNSDGSFDVSLTAPTAVLDPTKSYALYTWQAHAHSNTTQDTVTPLEIDWAAIGPFAATLTPAVAANATYGARTTLSVALPANATGAVTLTGAGATQSAAVRNGTATFTLPTTLPVGSYTGSFAYSGDSVYSAATTTASFVVSKATPAVKVGWKKKPGHKAKGKLRVAVTGVTGAATPTGGVSAVLTHGKKTVKAKAQGLSGGKTVLKVKKLPKKGKWKLVVTYAGDASYSSTTAKSKVKAKK